MTQKVVDLLINKIVKELPISNNLFIVIVVQFNIKRHLINYYRIYKLAKEESYNVYIFPTSYTRSKTRNKNLVRSKKQFNMQNRGTVLGLGLLYYTESILIAMLSNICFPISLINEARYIFEGIIPDDDNIFNLRLVNN